MSVLTHAPPLGARLHEDGRCTFRVWAPAAERAAVRLLEPDERIVPLERGDDGYHETTLSHVAPWTRYRFRLDDEQDLPDPASRFQPEGVHGPSAVVPAEFAWRTTEWSGLALDDFIIYELHVGTFTETGTLDAAAVHLEGLRDLGITAIELMPVAQFPGERNWGYDGVFPFATQNSYGGPEALKRFVDRCHELGMAAILDVVYNHLGPEGNYLASFGPYFTDRYRTPWGDALNFDGAESDEVRNYFLSNALQWLDEFRFDALRLDAVHAIVDASARPFLQQLAEAARTLAESQGRTVYLIAESDLADPRMVRPIDEGGLGMDAQWLDDFHHALHALLTEERDGYYVDYGDVAHLANCLRGGFVLAGDYSRFRRRRHGAPSPDIAPARFVVCSQNHDQIGNRMKGDRLTKLVDHERLRLAAAATLLTPFTPLLFMGEEYGETAPFPYFVSHGDGELIEAVRRGRREEFAAFAWAGEPPDPQAVATFERARLERTRRDQPRHRELLALYRELIEARRGMPHVRRMADDAKRVSLLGSDGRTLALHLRHEPEERLLLLHFAEAGTVRVPDVAGRWRRRIDTAEAKWGGEAERPASPIDADGAGLTIELARWSAMLLIREAA